MYEVIKQINFCYGHRLLNYDGKCRHVHGHNGMVEVVITTETLDRLGMAMDFTTIKSKVKGWIDTNLDHRMILNEKDPLIPWLKENNEPVTIIPDNPTAENIAKLIFNSSIENGIPVKEIRLWETPSSCAIYK